MCGILEAAGGRCSRVEAEERFEFLVLHLDCYGYHGLLDLKRPASGERDFNIIQGYTYPRSTTIP